MTPEKVQERVNRMIAHMDAHINDYQSSPADWSISEGNVAVCILDESGNVWGKIWGKDKLRGRKCFDIAYRKASQVCITGYKTNEFERLVFTDQLNYRDFGIPLPELMGWEGGQPIVLDAETKISSGFRGFKGVTDLAIVKKAVEETGLLP